MKRLCAIIATLSVLLLSTFTSSGVNEVSVATVDDGDPSKKTLNAQVNMIPAEKTLDTQIDKNTKQRELSTELYVETKECPAEMIEYVKKEAADFVLSGTEGKIPSETVEVGMPFCYLNMETGYDMFLFPVLFDHQFQYVLRVSDYNGMVSGTCSQWLAEELNSLSAAATEQTPAAFFLSNEYLYVEIGEEIKILDVFPGEQRIGDDYLTEYSDIPTYTVNIKEPLVKLSFN